jgi:hypothetical protein
MSATRCHNSVRCCNGPALGTWRGGGAIGVGIRFMCLGRVSFFFLLGVGRASPFENHHPHLVGLMDELKEKAGYDWVLQAGKVVHFLAEGVEVGGGGGGLASRP